jgi:hypothetical protein
MLFFTSWWRIEAESWKEPMKVKKPKPGNIRVTGKDAVLHPCELVTGNHPESM